ncbi:MAG: DUF4012 domain-containing protein [Actinomycetota bacterium]|nr:DUF4012 domain-containing protein [Actinomycetota bacterium]
MAQPSHDGRAEVRPKRKAVLIVLGAILVIASLSAFVVIPVVQDLQAAQRLLSRSPDLETDTLRPAREHLAHARNRLHSLPATLLRLLPVARQNVDALRAVSGSGLGVVDAGIDLATTLRSTEQQGLTRPGRIRIAALRRLREPVRRQADALAGLESQLRSHRGGWLLPPLWDRVDALLSQSEDLSAGAEAAAGVVDIAPALLGSDGPRDYLVLLLNNTELRGAGGILSGVGFLTIDNGRIELGDFSHYKELADPSPFRRVPSPSDFQDHFSTYRADTTRWVTTSSSPDVPDVALVAKRLYELTAGPVVDGAIVVDPRGLASLMPRRARIRVPTTDRVLRRDDVPEYVYSDAYSQLGGAEERRRESLIVVGQAAFSLILQSQLDASALTEDAAAAAAGGHLRVVSFDPKEHRVLESAAITGNLGTPEGDAAMATVQNLGGNKLDFYAQRSLSHACRVDPGAPTSCQTAVVIKNRTPLGLTRYEFQYFPYGLFKNFLEIYVPAAAQLEAVQSGGKPIEFITYREDGYKSVGVYLEIPRSETAGVTVRYTLPEQENGYSLEVRPQPLTEDGKVELRLFTPPDWRLSGPDGARVQTGRLLYRGRFDQALELEAGPSDRTGLSSLWVSLSRFWNEPLF